MEEGRLAISLIFTTGAFVTIMGVRFIIREALAKAYCICRHEYNQHFVLPRGMKPAAFGIPKGEPCRVCPCKKYKKNDKDTRNTGSIRFF
ncbi:MAG TPA: hypothetical protein VEP90_05975 [Methylomirabilota bacterium]|nr:hypothetical protein [Methylomirabilota bacterium]